MREGGRYPTPVAGVKDHAVCDERTPPGRVRVRADPVSGRSAVPAASGPDPSHRTVTRSPALGALPRRGRPERPLLDARREMPGRLLGEGRHDAGAVGVLERVLTPGMERAPGRWCGGVGDVATQNDVLAP